MAIIPTIICMHADLQSFVDVNLSVETVCR